MVSYVDHLICNTKRDVLGPQVGTFEIAVMRANFPTDCASAG